MSGPVVCVVGAGTAGLEGLLSARAQLGAAAELRLIAPNREFRYRPISRDSPLRPARERSIPIATVVADVQAEWNVDCAEVVRAGERQVVTRDGDTVEFDFLLLAAGARSRRSLHHGYTWERGQDPGFLDQIILDLDAGKARSIAIVVPRGARWPLPAYELALVIAWSSSAADARVTLITAEDRPLGALGPAAADAVTRELDQAGVETVAGVEALDDPAQASPAAAPPVMLVRERPGIAEDALIGRPSDPARVHMGAGAARQFDRLIALPTMTGPAIAGVPTDAAGFVRVDQSLRAWGNEPVWAAGGCIATPLEHSALSAQQADAAIAAIAAASRGSQETEAPGVPELSGILLAAQRDRWLAENPRGTRQPSTRCLWWPSGRAVGRMLAARIAAWDPSVGSTLPAPPDGVTVRTPVLLGGPAPAAPDTGEVTDAVRKARIHDIEHRQLRAVGRREHEAESELRRLRTGLETLADRQQEVIRSLRRQGYLREHHDGTR